MRIQAVIFDLDGVIVSTDELHYEAWKRMSDEEGLSFDRQVNEKLRGVSRTESLEIILAQTGRDGIYTEAEKSGLTERKNTYYRQLLRKLTPEDILPGVERVLKELRSLGIQAAIGSSSKNTPEILERVGLAAAFDAVADGNQIRNSKPNPEVFLLAARKLGIAPEQCLVVEDAEAGIEAALAGGMKAVGVGYASSCTQAHIRVKDLTELDIRMVLE